MNANKEKMISLLNEWDPIKLVRRGAPADEYSSEAEMICDYINSYADFSTDELAEEIDDVFAHSFGRELYTCDLDRCKAIAEKIIVDND